jgi:hypothetical protein
MTKALMIGTRQMESFDFGGPGVSPAGFEDYFREVAAAWGDTAKFAQINEKYALEMRFDSVPDVCQRFGLTFPAL